MNLDGIPTTITTGGINLPSDLGYANMTYMLANLRVVKGHALYTANYTRTTAWGVLPLLVTVPSYPVDTRPFTLTLNPVNFSEGRIVPVTTGPYTLTINPVNTIVAHQVPVTTSSLSLTFNSVGLGVVYTIPVTPLNLSLVTSLVNIAEQSGTVVSSLPLTMTLTDVGLTFGVTNIPVVVDTLNYTLGIQTVSTSLLKTVSVTTLPLSLNTYPVLGTTVSATSIDSLLMSLLLGQVGVTRSIPVSTTQYNTTFENVVLQGSTQTTIAIDTLSIVLTTNNLDVFNGNLKFYTSQPRIYL
jgi:hypothetical protein